MGFSSQLFDKRDAKLSFASNLKTCKHLSWTKKKSGLFVQCILVFEASSWNKTYKVQLSNPDCLGKRRSWSRSACDWCKSAARERQCCVSSLARRHGFCQVWRRSIQALHTRNCQGGSMSMFKYLLGGVLQIYIYIHTYRYYIYIYIHIISMISTFISIAQNSGFPTW